MIQKTNPKVLSKIQSEWDAMCSNRHDVIESGKDISLIAVTAPCIIDELSKERVGNILDVGCGTGYLTSQLSKHAKRCVGVDISPKSIAIAKSRYENPNVEFVNGSIADFHSDDKFDICVANMVFSCDPDWIDSIKAIHKLLTVGGKLFVMLPHPCYWPKYWGLESEPWFSCNEEIFIEHNFSVSLAKKLGTATYIHRPLSMYISKICEMGFSLEQMREPYPVREFPDEYKFEFPRFLFLKFLKKDII